MKNLNFPKTSTPAFTLAPPSFSLTPLSITPQPVTSLKRRLKKLKLNFKHLFDHKRKFNRKGASVDDIILAIDSEWTNPLKVLHNDILSYQWVVSKSGKRCSGIIYTRSGEKSDRIAFKKLVKVAIETARKKGIIDGWPENLICAAHFMRADLLHFSEAFTDIKTKVNGMRKTLVSLKGSYGIDYEEIAHKKLTSEDVTFHDKSRHKHTVNVKFYDTMLLAPAGKSLADIGKLVGQPKIDIQPPYSIERMDILLKENEPLFRQYAINDAYIACLHMERMIEFVKSIGLKTLPFTLGSIAVKALMQTLPDEYGKMFGFNEVEIEHWPEKKAKPLTKKVKRPIEGRAILEQLATNSYDGGDNRNFVFGPTEHNDWNDFDLPSCYTAISVGIRPLDYDAMYMTSDPEKFRDDTYGLARIKFSFPKNTRFPCLSVRTDNGLIFPLSGKTTATSKEIEVALSLGCKIEIIQGFIIPWIKGAPRVFENHMKWVRDNRNKYPKGSFEERLFKELGNGTYGKTAQGLRGKSSFDNVKGLFNKIPPSSITNPYYATYITGFARALLGELLNSIPRHCTVISVTTDGFLTNATLADIDLNGPVANEFRQYYHTIDNDGGEILELKHKAKRLFAVKTRFQTTLELHPDFPPVEACASIKVPTGENKSEYALKLLMERFPGMKIDVKTLISNQEQFMTEADMVEVENPKKIGLEPDCKVQLCNPREAKISGKTHIVCDTKPFSTMEDANFYRIRFNRWRQSNCLKTLDDWHNWNEFFEASIGLKHCKNKVRLKKDEGTDGVLLRLFLRAYAQELLGLSRAMTYAGLSRWLTDNGYPTSPSQARGGINKELHLGLVRATDNTVKLLKLLLDQFPDFNYEPLFAPDCIDELHYLLGRN